MLRSIKRACDHVVAVLSRKAVAITVVAGALALTFAFDRSVPIGVTGGITGVFAVLAARLLPTPVGFIVVAFGVTVSVIVGYFVTIDGDVPRELTLINRSATILLIWIVALSLYYQRQWKLRVDSLEQELDKERQSGLRAHHLAEQEEFTAIEMSHRLKNVLAQVNAIIWVTLRHAPSTEAAAEVASSRINALARTHELIAEHGWLEAPIRSLLRQEMALYGEDRFWYAGPDLRLTAKAAFALNVAIYELMTNAVKYGALSTPEGHISISWFVDGNRLILNWRETDGPPVSPPRKEGFGISLIKQALSHELGGTATLDFSPDGVSCRLELPLEHVVDQLPSHRQRPGSGFLHNRVNLGNA